MGPFAALVQAPFAAISGGGRAESPTAGPRSPACWRRGLLGLYLARLARRRGCRPLARSCSPALCLVNPLTFEALEHGPPGGDPDRGARGRGDRHRRGGPPLAGRGAARPRGRLEAVGGDRDPAGSDGAPGVVGSGSRLVSGCDRRRRSPFLRLSRLPTRSPRSTRTPRRHRQRRHSLERLVPGRRASTSERYAGRGSRRLDRRGARGAARWSGSLCASADRAAGVRRFRSRSLSGDGRSRLSGPDAMALFALLALLRCALDPVDNVYYHLPLLLGAGRLGRARR